MMCREGAVDRLVEQDMLAGQPLSTSATSASPVAPLPASHTTLSLRLPS